MEQEYTISTGWKIFMISVATILIGFSIFLFSLGEGKSNNPFIILLPISILIGGIWIIVQQIRKKIIITDESITRINAFGSKEIAIKDVKGCRIGDKVIYIEAVSVDNAEITINNYDLLGNSEELKNYFKENFKDIDAIDLENEREKMLKNTALGVTEKDREAAVIKAKQIGWIYNILGMILGFSLIVVDSKLAVWALMFYPLIGILVIVLSKGLIKFVSNSKTSVYGFTMLGFLLPAFVLLIKSLGSYDFYQYNNFWLPFFGISIFIFIILYIFGINESAGAIKGQIILMAILALLYGGGSTRQINCTFDQSTPKSIQTTVNSKSIEYSKGTHFYLKLNSWHSDIQSQNIEVSRSIFNRYQEGSSITVYVKSGVLNIPWYYVSQ